MDRQNRSVDMFGGNVAFCRQRWAGFNLIIANDPPFFKADQELLTNRVMHYSQATFSIIFHATTPYHQERGEGTPVVVFVYPQSFLFTHSASVFVRMADAPLIVLIFLIILHTLIIHSFIMHVQGYV